LLSQYEDELAKQKAEYNMYNSLARLGYKEAIEKQKEANLKAAQLTKEYTDKFQNLKNRYFNEEKAAFLEEEVQQQRQKESLEAEALMKQRQVERWKQLMQEPNSWQQLDALTDAEIRNRKDRWTESLLIAPDMSQYSHLCRNNSSKQQCDALIAEQWYIDREIEKNDISRLIDKQVKDSKAREQLKERIQMYPQDYTKWMQTHPAEYAALFPEKTVEKFYTRAPSVARPWHLQRYRPQPVQLMRARTISG
jgi:hypothetical protein